MYTHIGYIHYPWVPTFLYGCCRIPHAPAHNPSHFALEGSLITCRFPRVNVVKLYLGLFGGRGGFVYVSYRGRIWATSFSRLIDLPSWTLEDSLFWLDFGRNLYFLISYLGQVDVCVSCPSRKKHTSKPTLYLLYSLYSIYHNWIYTHVAYIHNLYVYANTYNTTEKRTINNQQYFFF